jgi:threonine aldolase
MRESTVHDSVDLRSDTLTLPTAAMRDAMARAEVGDDVWEEDPTVKRLEAMAASRVGKEAGLLVTSGTQGNLVSVVTQTRAGQEIVLDADCHIFNYEVGGAAVVGNVQTRPIKTARGFLTPAQVREAIRPANIHLAVTGLVCIENTHNRHGGTCCTPEEIGAIAEVAHAAGVPVHLDGARLFNAAVALGRPASDFTRHVDSVTFCLSKGLGAPIGSLVCGSADLVARARRVRKMLGGGMRQAGVIAAAGIVALETMVDRLAEDHRNARTLAEAIAKMPALSVDLASVQTNIVIFRVERPGDPAASEEAAKAAVAACAARKVKIHAIGGNAIRCVTHKDVDADDIGQAIAALREVTSQWA